jgi:hypothetical protein
MKREECEKEIDEIRADVANMENILNKVKNELDDERLDRKADKRDARILLGFICLVSGIVLACAWILTSSWGNAYEIIGSLSVAAVWLVLLIVGTVCIS